MDDNRISFAAFESITTRYERSNRRIWILCLVLIVVLLATNLGWVIFESQWETAESMTITQDVDATDGGDAIINDGVHINGENKADDHEN